MGKVIRIKYFTKDKVALINPDNLKLYDKYLKSNIIKNKEVEGTTYLVYKNYMTHFLAYLAENWDNINLYDEKFFVDAIDIMEGFIAFCQDTLKNNKKVINTKISAVSSFYIWSFKRKLISRHPFDKLLERMKGANEEKIINSYFLTEEQVQKVNRELEFNDKYDIQDKILWHISMDSANRIGAISKCLLSKLDLKNGLFSDIREKRGYRVEVVFDEVCKEEIQEWLKMREEDYDLLKCDGLFIAKVNGEYRQMSKSSLQSRIKKIGKILGLEDFHAHCTRKTASNLILEETGDITMAAQMLNHKSIETTRASYIKEKPKSELRDKIKQMKKEKEDKRIKEEQKNEDKK